LRKRTGSDGCGEQRDDPLDIRDEPHVQHPVSLVDVQDLDIVQEDPAAFDLVEQSPGSGDQHVNAAVELQILFTEGAAADQQCLGE